MSDKKSCNVCLKLTEHKFIETVEKIIPDYRPSSGRRLLAPRKATEIKERWQCTECGHYGFFSTRMEYKEKKKQSLTTEEEK